MRGAIGAVLNLSLLMKTRGMLFCIVLAAAAMVVYAVTDNDIARTASMLTFLLLIPLTTLNSSNTSFDSKWNRIEKLWDVSPFVMIAARYIVYAVISVTLAAIWVATPFHDGDIQNVTDFVTLLLLVAALYYPVMYALNSDHNIGILIIFFAAFIAFLIIIRLAAWQADSWADGFYLVTLGIVGGIYVASLVLSTIFSHIHMGRGA